MLIETKYLERCIATLEKAHSLLLDLDRDSIDFGMYRSASVKEFELILEQSGKLLKKCLKPFFSSSKEVDQMYFKDIFRNAAKHGLLTIEEVERWIKYRDNRNSTAHEYGANYAKSTLELIPSFLLDSKSLVRTIKKQNENTSS
ncbi:MAG: nucleotidyltransferase substrate binding protein [Bdellovibrionales bacterium]